jgi:hypothetical protein
MEIVVVITGEPLPGVFAWEVSDLGLVGKSRQPFLDACRAISRAASSPSGFAVLAWAGRPGWALRARIGVAARVTTTEERRDGGPRFALHRDWGQLPRRPQLEGVDKASVPVEGECKPTLRDRNTDDDRDRMDFERNGDRVVRSSA